MFELNNITSTKAALLEDLVMTSVKNSEQTHLTICQGIHNM